MTKEIKVLIIIEVLIRKKVLIRIYAIGIKVLIRIEVLVWIYVRRNQNSHKNISSRRNKSFYKNICHKESKFSSE